MRRLRCPQCGTVVTAPEWEVPVCPGCGFGAPPAPPAPEASEPYGEVVFAEQEPPPAPPEGPAEEAWPAPEAWPEQPQEEGSEPAQAWPPEPAAEGEPLRHGPPGKPRSPAVVILLTIVTLGIYGLVWIWKTAREVDLRRGTWWASPMVRPAVVLMVVAMFLAVVGAVVAVYLVDLGQPAGVAQETPEADAARTGAWVLYGLAALLDLVAVVLFLVGSWRKWQLIRSLEVEQGGRKPLSPGAMLALCLLAAPTLGITFYAMMGVVQSHLNRVWQGPAAPEAS